MPFFSFGIRLEQWAEIISWLSVYILGGMGTSRAPVRWGTRSLCSCIPVGISESLIRWRNKGIMSAAQRKPDAQILSRTSIKRRPPQSSLNLSPFSNLLWESVLFQGAPRGRKCVTILRTGRVSLPVANSSVHWVTWNSSEKEDDWSFVSKREIQQPVNHSLRGWILVKSFEIKAIWFQFKATMVLVDFQQSGYYCPYWYGCIGPMPYCPIFDLR